MTARKTTPAAPTLAAALADVDERREERLRQRAEIKSEAHEAKRAISRFAAEREDELRAATTANRKPNVAKFDAAKVENEGVIADAMTRLRQVESEIAKLDRERHELVDAGRGELVAAAVEQSDLERDKLQAALAALDDWQGQRAAAEKAWRVAWSGVKRAPDEPLAARRVGNAASDPTLPWASAIDLVDLTSEATYIGHGVSRWNLPALLREVRQKLASASCVPAALIAGRDAGNGQAGRYIDMISGQPVEVHRDQIEQARNLIVVDELGFARLRRERDLSREEIDRHRREVLATTGHVGPYDPHTGGIVLPDDRERDAHGGVVLDPDAPPEPSVSFIR
jgi:hypothetical protein